MAAHIEHVGWRPGRSMRFPRPHTCAATWSWSRSRRQPAGPGTECPRGRRLPGRVNGRTYQAASPRFLSGGEPGRCLRPPSARCCGPAPACSVSGGSCARRPCPPGP